MNELGGVIGAAVEVQHFCQSQGWQFCFIGGIAVQRWGMPRFTQDVDLTLLTGFGSEKKFADTLLDRFSGRLKNSGQVAVEHRVLLVRTASGVDVDISFGGLVFEENAVARATLWPVSNAISLLTCTAEDLITHKVFAGRDHDWGDVESVLVRQHGQLNFTQIRTELSALLELKEDTESMDKFERMTATVDRRLCS